MTSLWNWLAVVLLALSGCKGAGGPGSAQSQAQAQELPPQVTLHGVRLHSWQRNELVATGTADTLTYDRVTANFGAQDAVLRFPKSASGAVELRAPEATGNLNTRLATGTGGVTVRAENGLTGETPRVDFDGVGMVARGPERVKLSGPGYWLDAQGFTFYFVTEELLFEGDVHSRLGPVQ